MLYDKNLLTAIIVIQIPGEKPVFKKYRNIKDTPFWMAKLETFAKKNGAHHVNIYRKRTKEFVRQIKIE